MAGQRIQNLSMAQLIKNSLKVSVSAFDKLLNENAVVTIIALAANTRNNDRETKLPFNKLTGVFTASGLSTGAYIIRAEAKGYELQERSVTLNSGEQEEAFILGKKGMPFYYRGKVKVPFTPLPRHLGIVLADDQKHDGRQVEFVKAIAKRYKMREVESHDNYRKNGLYVFALNEKTTDEEQEAIQREIQANENIALCVPVLRLLDKNATLLTSNIIVRFRDNIKKEEINEIAKEFGIVVLRHIPYAGNAYQFALRGPASYRILDICERLVISGKVEYAEPDLWHTIEEDAITPSDWLYPEQWDHPLINMPNAWQVLHDIDANKTFGDPNVIIALFDSGIDAAHPSFAGNLTDGTPKVYQLFDFGSMVPNNNNAITDPGGGHGTCTAGAATGKANDPSSVAGVNDGTAGIAGNCKVIGVRRSGPESRYSDAYIWTAGFDPHSVTAGFPTPINPGADIISNSFGVSVGSPISGLMKDTFDFLTTYGRNGKGVLLFFSTGNNIPKVAFDTTNTRPWAAYKKNFAIGATSIGDDGVTESATNYSNFGNALEFCALSHDEYVGGGIVHNPPLHYGAIATTRRGTGNMPGRPTVSTTLTANANTGNTTLTLASTTGMSGGTQAVMINNPGTAGAEGKSITTVNSTTQITFSSKDIDGTAVATSGALFRNHPSGGNVFASSGDYTNCMGGTSYATPVCAGVAALVLSVNSDLSWIEVRQLIRSTCVKVDANNTDANGRWTDTAGRISSDPGYTGPFFSKWYGYGRVDAAAAVTATRDYTAHSDVLVRDNLADAGTVPSAGAFWNSPDIWVRQHDPVTDGAAALPAGYASNPPHQNAVRGQNNWVYVRLKNTGTIATNNFYVRLYIAHWPGTEFIFPNDFIPSNNPGAPIPSPMTPGTYLIGETLVSSLAAGPESIISMQWDAAKVPPDTVMVSGSTVHWHPCLLVQVTPFDGPAATGNHVWDSNNLAQKNITIADMGNNSVADNAIGFVVGNQSNKSRVVELEIDRGKLPKGVRLYMQVMNTRSMDWIIKNQKQVNVHKEHTNCCSLKVLDDTRAILHYDDGSANVTLSLTRNSVVSLCGCKPSETYGSYTAGKYRGKSVLLLDNDTKVRVPVLRSGAQLIPVIVGFITDTKPEPGSYDISINQYDANNTISGSYGITLKF